MKQIKTVTEWLGELNLVEKKIKKEFDFLSKTKLFNVSFKEDSELYKNKIEEEEKNIKSSYESLNSLIKNREKIRSAILAFNATNTIKIGEKEYLIAIALEKIKSKEIINILPLIEKQISEKIKEEERLSYVREEKREYLQSNISSKANSSTLKDMEAVEKQMEKFTVISKDYLNLSKIYDSISNENIEFEEYVNTQLNIKNATTNLEIDY